LFCFSQNKDIALHTHIYLGKTLDKASKVIENSLSQYIGQLGLSASIGIGLTGGKGAGAGLHPFTRLAMGLGCGAALAAVKVGASAANRAFTQIQTNNNIKDNETPTSPSDTFVPNIYESTVVENITNNSVELLLSSILVLNLVNLLFIVILLLTFISKLILSYNFILNWIDRILP
jgi:hypothetical protein